MNANLKEESGTVEPVNFGTIRIKYTCEFFQNHIASNNVNGLTYVATGESDPSSGNMVFNGHVSNACPSLVQPIRRYGNLPPASITEGGENAPVITIGNKTGYLIELNYQVNQSSEDPTLILQAPGGPAVDATGCLYTQIQNGANADATYLISEKTIQAMQ